MKKLVLTLAAFVLSVAFVAPAAAKDRRIDRAPSILECGLFFIPANCSPLDRIVGGTIVGGTLAATTTASVAGSYAVIGAGAGAATGLLIAR